MTIAQVLRDAGYHTLMAEMARRHASPAIVAAATWFRALLRLPERSVQLLQAGGKWKLVREYKKPWELYDLDNDRAEMHDLSKTSPEQTAQMVKLWTAWARQNAVAFPERFNMYEFLKQKDKLNQIEHTCDERNDKDVARNSDHRSRLLPAVSRRQTRQTH